MPAFEACCAHDHDCAAEDCGPEWSLHKYIDTANVRSLFGVPPPLHFHNPIDTHFIRLLNGFLAQTPARILLLYKLIGLISFQVRCLNEAAAGSAKGVFRPWGERLDFSRLPLASNEDDEELLIHVPFNGSVKIKAICIIGARCISQPLVSYFHIQSAPSEIICRSSYLPS